MRGVVDALVFGALAIGLHLAVFAAIPAPHGGSGAGAEGTATVSLKGASAEFSELVARWSTAPDAAPKPALARPPVPDSAAPAMPRPPGPVAVPRQGPAPIPGAPDTAPPPQIRTAPPPPPVTARAPERATRPPARADARTETPPAPTQDARPTREQAPSAAPSRRADGSGGGAAAGERGRSAQPGLTPAQTRSLMAQWGGGIRAAVERRLRYPAGTSAAGTARIALSVSTTGRLGGARLSGSSGSPALDRAAMAAVRGARFPKAPRGLPAGTYSFTVPVTLRP